MLKQYRATLRIPYSLGGVRRYVVAHKPIKARDMLHALAVAVQTAKAVGGFVSKIDLVKGGKQ